MHSSNLGHPMLRTLTALLLLTMAIGSPAWAAELDCADIGNASEADAIREQRQAFNQAIVDKDPVVIEKLLHEDVTLITGTDSDLFKGKAEQVSIWADDFVRENRAIYVRTTACVRVSATMPVALESGTWRGERIDDSESVASGSYSAKWRKTGGQWFLEAEIFSTEACSGSFCQ